MCKVWLVGAGPGAAGLLTLRGAKVLEKADVVLYDRLVGDEVLAMIPQKAKAIDVGKKAGNHTIPQDEIGRILAEEALKGQRVVRLKGGDPFLFGRGGEELEILAEKDIPFEVVPGVTSPVAVPAYGGIPVTHRDMASSLHIITGHRRKGEDYDIDFEGLVSTGGTLVFLMGVASLPIICERLMMAGLAGNTPAAVVQQGTTSGQKVISGSLDTIEEEVEAHGVETPAIIVVGEVCSLSDRYNWFERLPLFGRKILVTRPAEKDSLLTSRLRELGAEVLEIPMIQTWPIQDNRSLMTAIESIEKYNWIVFTSPRGVNIFFKSAMDSGVDGRKMAGIKFACIGQGTGNALREQGIIPDLIPQVYDGEHLGKALAEACKGGERILIPRSAIGGKALISVLKERGGLIVDDVPIYETKPLGSRIIDVKDQFEKGKIDMAAFTSASAVEAFCEAASGLDMKRVNAACIGKQTAAAAEQVGMNIYVSARATLDSLVDLIREILDKQEGFDGTC